MGLEWLHVSLFKTIDKRDERVSGLGTQGVTMCFNTIVLRFVSFESCPTRVGLQVELIQEA